MANLTNVLARRSARLLLIGLFAAVATTVGVLMTARGGEQPAAAATPALAAPGPASTLLVFVSGAVAHPGMYELATGARVADAIADAGGILPTADLGKLPNLAGLVHDGHQVNVPFAKSSSAATSLKIDVNSASAAELEQVPGLSSDIAQAIVDVRAQWGSFANLADLRAAIGLDSATAALIGKHLRFVTTVP